jgi:hypothetical protein
MLIDESEKIGYYKKEAQSILNLPDKSINRLIKNGKLKTQFISKKKCLVTLESVLEYKKELDERRNMSKRVWVNRNDI